MKIAIIGASGKAGSRIRDEALARGHEVTAIARNIDGIPKRERLAAKQGDVFDLDGMARLVAAHDAVISSTRFKTVGAKPIVDAVKKAGVKRLLVVGGAGSLEVAPGQALVDTPDFPAVAKEEASAGRIFLNTLKAESALDWTFLSPSGSFAPGPRTGKFRLGKDALLKDAQGQSSISMEDYAIAMLDELEKPKHSRQRFTVGY
jgi:uncharacterized protein